MKASTLKYSVLTLTLSLISVIIAVLPFHAFLTIWASSLTGGHYTAWRLWKELLMVVAAFGVGYLLLFDHKVRFHTLKRKLTWLIVAYIGVQVVWGLVALHEGSVNLKAMAYGVLLNTRFLVFFLLAWAVAIRTDRLERRWPKLLLWPAVIVVLFGLLQAFFLPHDFLSHFGYGPNTIEPYETINHNMMYYRYMSTLRGANPLGAYLIVPISALVVLLARYPKSWNWTKVLLLLGSVVLLYFSFSRSAWIGAVLSAITALVITSSRDWWRRFYPLISVIGGIMVATVLVLTISQHNNPRFQNFIFHTQSHSAVKSTSDGAHLTALSSGVHDILHQPLGRGPGSAGPASTYNNHPGRIAEDYYIQIGQETGWLGLVLFVGIVAVVGYLLWCRRRTPLALTLLAALVGISFVNLLSHAWTDDTLCYIWWGLAGLAIGTPVGRPLDSLAPVVPPVSAIKKHPTKKVARAPHAV